MHSAMRRERSQGLEMFLQLGSPCGFPKYVNLSQRCLAYRFIRQTKLEIGAIWHLAELMRVPPHLAKQTAASLPLGSISAQSSCSMVSTSPGSSAAVVPVMSLSSSSTTILSLARETFFSIAMWQTVQKVIILVRLAIQAVLLCRLPVTIWREGYSITMKLSAFIFPSSFLSKQNRGFYKSTQSFSSLQLECM